MYQDLRRTSIYGANICHFQEALLHKDRKYGNNKRVAQETYSKGRDE